MALTQISTQGIKDGTITGTDLATNVDLVDNQKLRLGTSNDLQIYHDDTTSRVHSVSKPLLIKTIDGYDLTLQTNSENAVVCKGNAAVELYYNNSKKFETTSAGVKVGDDLKVEFGDGDDLEIYHASSSDVNIINSLKPLRLLSNGNTTIESTTAEVMVKAIPDGAVELYFNNSLRLSTTANGVTLGHNLFLDNATNAGRDVTWDPANDQLQWKDNTKASFGNNSDLQIYHQGSHSYIQDVGTGSLILVGNNVTMQNAAQSENMFSATENGAVELYFDGSKKFETQNLGVTVTGGVYPAATDTYQLGGSSLRWNELNIKSVIDVSDNGKIRMGDSDDLQIYHDGTNSFIKNSTGTLNIQGDTLRLTDSGLAHVYVKGISGGATELYHNNIKKFETASTGLLFPNTGTLSQNAIYFEAGASTNEYSTMFGVTNYPDASDFGDQNDGFWAKIKSRGGCVVIINSDGGRNDGRNTYDHFSVYHREGESTNGKRAFSVDHVGGVQFGQAGINIDREWGNQPSFSMTRDCNDGTNNTDDNAYFRFHGTAKTHSSWTGGSNGADFSANMLLDGGNYNASDRRAKTDIVDCPYGLAEVLKLRPRKYQLVNSQLEPQGDDNINLGFIAQELMEILPEPVNYLKNEDVPNEKGFCRAYILDMNEVVPVLTKAIQELAAKVAVLETEVAALKAA